MTSTAEPRFSLPREQIRVLLLEGIHERAALRFRDRGYTNVERLSGALAGDALTDALASARMVGIRSRTDLTEEVLAKAPRLIAVGCFCIGTNQVALRAAAERGIAVFNAPHSNTRSVAELVIGLSVMLFRGIFPKDKAAHRGEWMKSAVGAHELRGKTLGIVGYGHIGSQVSILAEAFGMRVLFHDIAPKLSLGNALPVGSLGALLEQSDLVTLHVPQAPDTVNLMDARRLGKMKPGAFLINASRGTVVDIDSLAEMLRSGAIAGAAVDVHPKEPATSTDRFESPLVGLDNAILSPHIGGSTEEAQQNIGVDVAEKLVAYSDTGSTIGSVNFPQLNLAPHHDCHRVLHVNRDRPGILREINAVFADADVNIVGEHFQAQGGIGYVVLDVEKTDARGVLKGLRAIGGTIRTRVLY